MSSDEQSPARRRIGALLIGVGLVMILWGVFHVLGAVGGPGDTFAERLPYDEVKTRLHGAFAGGFLRGLSGLAVALLGGHLRRPS